MGRLLIIDDEPQIRHLLARMMELEGYEVAVAADCRSGLRLVKSFEPEVVLCDVFLPDGKGIDMVVQIRQVAPDTEVVMLTAHGNIPDGVQAIKNGAYDYITKGDDNNRIFPLVAAAMQKAQKNSGLTNLKRNKNRLFTFDSIVGSSPAILEATSLAKRVAATDTTVLLTGQTGTGKELFAQAIHSAGRRCNGRFVAVNCSAISSELLESEMFGYRAGAFTGANKDKKGLLEEADGGTVFLDELGDLAVGLQAKLLRAIETGEYIKVGDTRQTKVDVRIISATNRNIEEQVSQGHFREDLFYRLSVFRINLPPLRERADDVVMLARMFVNSFSVLLSHHIEQIDADYLNVLRAHPWNGNVRELRNVIERSMIVCNDDRLKVVDLPLEMQRGNGKFADQADSFELSQVESSHIRRVLEYTGGNKTAAAKLLKIAVTTLYRKMEEYGL